MTEAFRPGDHVVVREVHKGKVWTLRPLIVVRDTPNATILYMPHGAIWRGAVTLDGETLRVPWQEWQLSPPKQWENHMLRISVRDEPYSLSFFWDRPWTPLGWYVNVEEPLHRVGAGFDYMDWTLDVLVSRGRRRHWYKDEDELAEAVTRGVYTSEHADQIRAAAARGLDHLTSRRPPTDEPWEDWRPDPAWGTPSLPEDA